MRPLGGRCPHLAWACVPLPSAVLAGQLCKAFTCTRTSVWSAAMEALAKQSRLNGLAVGLHNMMGCSLVPVLPKVGQNLGLNKGDAVHTVMLRVWCSLHTAAAAWCMPGWRLRQEPGTHGCVGKVMCWVVHLVAHPKGTRNSLNSSRCCVRSYSKASNTLVLPMLDDNPPTAGKGGKYTNVLSYIS